MNFRKLAKKLLYGYVPGMAGSFPYFDCQVYFPKKSAAFYLACDQGVYERENLRVILGVMKPHTSYIDVGANIGLMSVPILQNCPTCQVISFEPSPNTLPYLHKTQQNSKAKNRWHIIGKAAGNSIGTVEFFTASPALSLFDGLRDTKRVNTNQASTIEMTKIDTEWKGMKKPTVSVIKIDVEGAERFALEGAVQCIEHENPHILVEWNATNLRAYDIDSTWILQFAKQMDYQILSLPYLAPITDYKMLMLNMLTTESFLLTPKR